MLESLRAHAPNTVELPCGKGSILLPPSLAGRIFCQWDGELIHRLDAASLGTPAGGDYINFGGNSLWPAPEGGEYAFNYAENSDAWLVQDGIATAPVSVSFDGDRAVVNKQITLNNRKGKSLNLTYYRAVSAEIALVAGYVLEGMRYYTEDRFDAAADQDATDVLLAPWSLEQFPGAEGIVAFGTLGDPSQPLNLDFYGDPGHRIVHAAGQFTFHLGGVDRHQIGIPVTTQPTLIGALDLNRSLLFVRRTAPQPGRYFNIADNDQAAGPWSAADLYSIFNGGELGFFELETIGAMNVDGGRLGKSSLRSETLILKGSTDELLRYSAEVLGVHLEKAAAIAT